MCSRPEGFEGNAAMVGATVDGMPLPATCVGREGGFRGSHVALASVACRPYRVSSFEGGRGANLSWLLAATVYSPGLLLVFSAARLRRLQHLRFFSG